MTDESVGIPEELTGPTPRRIRPKNPDGWPAKCWRSAHWSGLAASILSILLLVADHYFWSSAPSVTGRVIEVYQEKGGRVGPHWRLHFSFIADGETTEGDQVVSTDLASCLKWNDPIQIRARRFGASVVDQIEGQSGDGWTLLPIFTLLIVPIMIVGSVVRCHFERRRQERLLRFGLPAVAEILGIGTRSLRFGPAYGAECRFQTGDRRQFAGIVPVRRESEESLKIGQHMVVVYDPDRPGKNIRYLDLGYVVAEPK